MTREEQAKQDCSVMQPVTIYDKLAVMNYENGVKNGVEWADSHPNWHKYPEDKPPKNQAYNCLACGTYVICEYKPDLDKFYSTSSDTDYTKMVKFWIELPKSPNINWDE